MTNNIAQSVKEVYPSLSDKEIKFLLDRLHQIIATKISASEQIASVRKNDIGDYEQITLKIPVPVLLRVWRLFGFPVFLIRAFDVIYFLLCLVAYGSYDEVEDMRLDLNSGGLETLGMSGPSSKFTKVQHLRVISVHYGSPFTIDLLGIGNILEASANLIKDISWRANHEKKLAELERKNKGFEIEEKGIEVTAQKLALEKTSLEIALQKIEVLEKLNSLPLSDDDKKLIASAIVSNTLALIDYEISEVSVYGAITRSRQDEILDDVSELTAVIGTRVIKLFPEE